MSLPVNMTFSQFVLASPLVAALRNNRGGLLLLLALVLAAPMTLNKMAAATGPGYSVELPHWAANGGWNSRWSVVNASGDSLSCTLNLVGPDGKVVSLNTTAGAGNSIPFTVPQAGRTIIEAGDVSGSVESGSSSVSCSGGFLANVTYAWMPDGVALTEVTVSPIGRFLNHVLAANAFTGLALYDPDPKNPSTATITAFDLNGNHVGSATATVPANGKNAVNLNNLITNLPSSFEGSVLIKASNPLAVVAIDVTPGANGSFVLGNVPVVGYDGGPASLSGTYNFVSGPRSGQSGNLTTSNFSPIGNFLGSVIFLANATSGSITGAMTVEVLANGTAFARFFNNFTPLSNGGAALTQLPDGSFSGSVFVPEAAGISVGTITLH